MIRSYLGEDTQLARKEARECFEKLRAENQGSTTSYFDDVLFDTSLATEAFTSENLFGGENILYFDGILDHEEGESFYRNILKETAHNVIIREFAPSKDLRAFLGRLGEVKEFPFLKKAEKRIDSFQVANALGGRDKRSSWLEFEKVRRAGIAMEEVHGTVFWCFKSMLLTSTLNKQEAMQSGMKEYTYRSYHSYSKNYAVDELKDKLRKLKDIYHKGHRGEGNLEELLEQFILNN